MDFHTRKRLFNRCNPNEALDPIDSRYVPFDECGDPESRVRGVDWVERLAARIELSDQPECLLFTGLRGSGKSTVLRRLVQRLGDQHRSNLLAVIIDAEAQVDLTQPVDAADILAGVLAYTEAAVLRAEGREPEQALADGPLARLWTWLTNTDVELKEANVALASYGSLGLEFKTRPTLRQRVREIVARHPGEFLRQIGEGMLLLQARAGAKGRFGLFVIVDSLEKLQGMTHNYDDVLLSAERLFGAGAPYLKLPVHALYTIPPALTARRAFHDVNFLPMVRIAEQNGPPCPNGHSALRELVRRRVSDAELEAHLGPDFEERVSRLIRWSGGYPRELVRLLQTVWTHERALSESDLDRICSEVTDSYRKIVRDEDADWLARVALQHYVTTVNDDEQKIADRMLSSNAVLRYLNGEDWFALHPAVHEVPVVQAALKAERVQAKQS